MGFLIKKEKSSKVTTTQSGRKTTSRATRKMGFTNFLEETRLLLSINVLGQRDETSHAN
jgi:hypothetical protein